MISPSVTLNARRRVIKALKKAKKQSRKHRHQQMHWTNGSAEQLLEKTVKKPSMARKKKEVDTVLHFLRYCSNSRIPFDTDQSRVSWHKNESFALVLYTVPWDMELCAVLLRVSTKYTSTFSSYSLFFCCPQYTNLSLSLCDNFHLWHDRLWNCLCHIIAIKGRSRDETLHNSRRCSDTLKKRSPACILQ